MGAWSDSDKRLFYTRLSAFFQAGATLEHGVALMAGTGTGGTTGEVVEALRAALASGRTLSDFAAARPDWFTRYEIEIIRHGEKTDEPAGSIHWLEEFFTDRIEGGRNAKAQTIGLAVAAVLGVVLIGFIIYFVLPLFEALYADFGRNLPVPTMMILDAGRFVREKWYLILIGLAALVYAARWIWRDRPELVSLAASYVPWLGREWLLRDFIHFAWMMGRALEKGLPPAAALAGATDFVSHAYLRGRLTAMGSIVGEGRPWADALARIARLPRQLTAFVRMGEGQGELDQALIEIWRTEAPRLADRKPGLPLVILLLMPVLISILILVIAMYLPIFSMFGTMS